jgi:hypothetical protein
MKQLIKTVLLAIFSISLLLTPQLSNAQTSPKDSVSIKDDESTRKYLKDLKRFIRSVNKEKYQPEGYWDEVDKLWEALKVRKEKLENKFNDAEREQIKDLENKYQTIRSKKTKLS